MVLLATRAAESIRNKFLGMTNSRVSVPHDQNLTI